MNKSINAGKIKKLAAVAVALLIEIALFLYMVTGTSDARKTAGRQLLEDSIREAALNCYVTEGYYPPSLEYITENYGITVSEDYIVDYSVFASNVMPEITILEI